MFSHSQIAERGLPLTAERRPVAVVQPAGELQRLRRILAVTAGEGEGEQRRIHHSLRPGTDRGVRCGQGQRGVRVADQGQFEVAPAVGHAVRRLHQPHQVVLAQLVGLADIAVAHLQQPLEERPLKLAAEEVVAGGVEPAVAGVHDRRKGAELFAVDHILGDAVPGVESPGVTTAAGGKKKTAVVERSHVPIVEPHAVVDPGVSVMGHQVG